jgi:hypothetical protein
MVMVLLWLLRSCGLVVVSPANLASKLEVLFGAAIVKLNAPLLAVAAVVLKLSATTCETLLPPSSVTQQPKRGRS